MNEYSSASNDEQNDVYSDNESSNHNSSNHNSTLIRAVVAVTASRRNRRRQPQPMHNSTRTGSMRVEELLNGHAEIIQGMINYVFHDGINGTGPSTGPQPHDPSREAKNQMRDHIADDMWERYQASPCPTTLHDTSLLSTFRIGATTELTRPRQLTKLATTLKVYFKRLGPSGKPCARRPHFQI
ncbi:hypothetical protein TIFTF001_012264 [Ficus carica]|uniref:Uncharacterized protein n=1 Tax=Ficus carica TaxID=3494 RepID=A0AA87ZVN5_FICCA|nr:hypothetical protein TIFTF001_012264 [Ficus carica]